MRNQSINSYIRDIAARGSLFEPSLLPDSVNQAIIGLCDIVTRQQDEINELKQSLIKANSDCSLNKTSLFKMNLQIQQLDVKNDIQKLFTKLSSIEENHHNFQNSVNGATQNIQSSIDQIIERSHDVETDLRLQIARITPEVIGLPTTFSKEDDQPIIIDNKLTDISPLVRGIYRDSRRIDGFDETISSLKIENENIVNAVATAQDNLQEFNRNLHDIGLSIIKYKTLQNERSRYFQSSDKSFESQIADIWSYISLVNDNLSHGLSTTMTAIDEIQSILTKMSSVPLPPIKNVSDVLLECKKNQEKLAERKTQFEGIREKFDHPPEDNNIDPIIGNLNVDNIRDKSKYKVNSKFDSLTNKFTETLLRVNVEDLRVKVNELTRERESINEKFEQLSRLTRQKIDDKVDGVTMERLFSKYQMLLDKISQKIESLESQSSEPKTSSRIHFNYDEPVRQKKRKRPNIEELPERQIMHFKEKPKSTLAQRVYGNEKITLNPNRAVKVSQRVALTPTSKLASYNVKHNDYE
ncbi:hypothetical protein M9Y10_010854 [Tritrichomonas musculus]|uniref:Uncharacterized protein n=1 Tax=Tritrichomonas musculus TaxID=1915356 RepID=A0ABR2ING0_9EUKA